jgi:anti-sigma factor RsiW
MNCKEIEQLQDAFVDQELDPANAHAFSEHLASCPSCTKQLEQLSTIKKTIKIQAKRHTPPQELAARIACLTATDRLPIIPLSNKFLPIKWGLTGAVLAVAACFVIFIITNPNEQYLAEQQLIASHIRSLQDGHLTDVMSTDQHTVKPWFNGRLDVSPPVTDFSTNGFPLVGGRIDYVDHHNVAVIVYRYNAHVINLFVWPVDQSKIDTKSVEVQQGYNMLHWHDGDLQFWAVSDVNPSKLSEFESLYRKQFQGSKIN